MRDDISQILHLLSARNEQNYHAVVDAPNHADNYISAGNQQFNQTMNLSNAI